jgi:hypothetical protein
MYLGNWVFGKSYRLVWSGAAAPREWERLHGLVVSEGVSIQTLAVRGLSLVFKEKGLRPIQ